MMSTVCAPVSCHFYFSHPVSTFILSMWKLGSREGKQLGQCGTGRKRQRQNSKPGLLDSKPLTLSLPAPTCRLHSGQAWWDHGLKVISPSSSPANPETIQSLAGEGRAVLKEKGFFLPSWLRGSSLPQAAEGKEGAEWSLNVHSPNCLSMTLSSHSRENAGPELKCRPKPFSRGFKRSFCWRKIS